VNAPAGTQYFTSQFSFNYTAMFAALDLGTLSSILIHALVHEQVTNSLVAGSAKG